MDLRLHPTPKLTANERVAAFARLWSEVKYNFAFFDQVPELDWDRVLEEYLPNVVEEQSLDEYYRLLQRCVARLQDGHTGVWGFRETVTGGPPCSYDQSKVRLLLPVSAHPKRSKRQN